MALTYGLLLSLKRLTSFRSSPGADPASDMSRTSILRICVWNLRACDRGVSLGGGAGWITTRRKSEGVAADRGEEQGPLSLKRTGGIQRRTREGVQRFEPHLCARNFGDRLRGMVTYVVAGKADPA
jgi:hypothetical protein